MFISPKIAAVEVWPQRHWDGEGERESSCFAASKQCFRGCPIQRCFRKLELKHSEEKKNV